MKKILSKIPPTVAWHRLSVEDVVQLLNTDLVSGLTAEEARHRAGVFGINQVSTAKRTSAFKRFVLQFHQPLLYILLAASGITLALGEWVDASVIFGVVFANALVGYLQESKAEKAIEALSRMVTTEASVRREGRKQRIPSIDLVPGDVVLLQSGDRVPADLRLSKARTLRVDESALTGESLPVDKFTDLLAGDAILAERRNLAYAGTLVTYGQAEGVVWATGDKTETGRIAWLISEAVDLSTPLTRKIAHFSKLLLYAILALAAVTFGVGLWRGGSAVEMFMAAVALAVGAIPEGLPAAVTIALAIGVTRMARRQAIIRKLPAVETLGSTTVICSDKTGTLTENQMTVQEIFAGGQAFAVTGTGYDPAGEFVRDGSATHAAEHGALMECLRAGLLCNDSQLSLEKGQWRAQGDPTEAALIVAAKKAGLIEGELAELHPRLDAIPFESEHQFMATLHHHQRSGSGMIYKKGAVERLLDRCATQLTNDGELSPLDRETIHARAERMAAKGMRVLALARREAEQAQQRIDHEHVAQGLTFLGLQGMIDPPRPEALEAVHRCQTAGIQVKMITGDHALTAKAIAAQIGLGRPGQLESKCQRRELPPVKEPAALTGKELAALSDAQLEEAAEQTSVFARVAPEQKLRLVKALQAQGHVVAMTGDGVNDAPALKQADIGVAMGRSGTDVAKGAADMLLTDDNFASIEAAVEEGRTVFDNLTKFIVWTLPTNAGEAAILLTAIFLGLALPALPVQLLWVNMTTAVLLGLMLVFEPKEDGLMSRPPRDPKRPLLSFELMMRTGLVTLVMLAGAVSLFYWEQRANGASLEQARTTVINVIVMVEVFYLFNCRCLLNSMFRIGLFTNPWVWAGALSTLAAQALFTYAPFMNMLFRTEPIGADTWLRILGVGFVAYAVVELEKWIRLKAAEATTD